VTVIAAAEDKHGIYIASDSHGTDQCDNAFELGKKIIKKHSYYIGFSYSYRVADLMRECSAFPKAINTITSLRKFRDVLKDLLTKDGCSVAASGANTISHPVSIIIISSKGIFTIDNDYQIHKITTGYIAIGSGYEIALGALRGLTQNYTSAEKAVELAVEAAIFHKASCGGNIHIQSIEK